MPSVTYTTPNGRLTFAFEVQSGKQAFEAVSSIQENFEEEECGCCKSKRIKFEVREFDRKKYFKMVCSDCQAQLDYGQNQDGRGIFVKRFEKGTRNPLPNRGWYVYDPSMKRHDDDPPPNQQQNRRPQNQGNRGGNGGNNGRPSNQGGGNQGNSRYQNRATQQNSGYDENADRYSNEPYNGDNAPF